MRSSGAMQPNVRKPAALISPDPFEPCISVWSAVTCHRFPCGKGVGAVWAAQRRRAVESADKSAHSKRFAIPRVGARHRPDKL